MFSKFVHYVLKKHNINPSSYVAQSFIDNEKEKVCLRKISSKLVSLSEEAPNVEYIVGAYGKWVLDNYPAFHEYNDFIKVHKCIWMQHHVCNEYALSFGNFHPNDEENPEMKTAIEKIESVEQNH